ncbi:dethiobiotin synthase [Clostridium arbusti]|jgi:dethiobiotin synthetase|uniref:dethiobiotin synthase n=1 Tax=Clostridium arbusti TaxID=1137848 RepID=UPI00028A002E|nr:dethiobiotin synthase [Clostridium arbusti]
MTKGIYIVGTDTDIGKTLVTGSLVYLLRKNGYNTCYYKAALSGAEIEDEVLIPGDTKFVCNISGINEKYEDLTPYIYKTAVSPFLASKIENKPIDVKVIKDKYEKLKGKYDYIICEGSGGIICPISYVENQIYNLDNLIKEMDMDVILVTSAELGTINHTILTVKYLENVGISIKGIIINKYENTELCNDNISMIKYMTHIHILGVMPLIDGNCDEFHEEIKKLSEKVFNPKEIIKCMR